MKGQLKQLGKDSVVYGIGGLAAKSVGFLLLPVFTRVFSPTEYGFLETLTVLNNLIGVLLVAGATTAQQYFFFEQEKNGKSAQSELITSVLQWHLSSGLVVVGLSVLVSPLLNSALFDGELTIEVFAVSFAGSWFFQVMTQSVDVFRLLFRPWKYILITLAQTLISSLTAVFLVVWLDWGILGYFSGLAAGTFSASLTGWFFLRDYISLSKIQLSWWPRILKYGIPLVPGSMSLYALNTIDRWFIIYFNGQHELGIYSVGAKFALLLVVVITVFRQAWWPVAMSTLHKPEGPKLFLAVSRLYLSIAVIGVVTLTAAAPLLVGILAGDAFFESFPIVGALAWFSVFFGFHMIISSGIWKQKKTYWISISMAIALIVNIVLNTWLVPRLGGLGAAIGTSASFLAWNVFTIIVSEKLWPIGYEIRVFLIQIGIGIAACIAITELHAEPDSFPTIIMIVAFSWALLFRLAARRTHFKDTIALVRSRFFRNSA